MAQLQSQFVQVAGPTPMTVDIPVFEARSIAKTVNKTFREDLPADHPRRPRAVAHGVQSSRTNHGRVRSLHVAFHGGSHVSMIGQLGVGLITCKRILHGQWNRLSFCAWIE